MWLLWKTVRFFIRAHIIHPFRRNPDHEGLNGMPASRLKQRGLYPRLFVSAALFFVLLGCSADNLASKYLLAERLWTEAKYSAAVYEFDRVTRMDPRGKLGLQALLRSADTQNLFLGDYGEALKKYETYLERTNDPKLAWEVKKQIGEILFTRQEKYEAAWMHYEEMLKSASRPEEEAEIHFRLAKCLFYLWRFSDAIYEYQQIIKKFPRTQWALQARYEWGITLYTQAAKLSGSEAVALYQQAVKNFREISARYPTHPLAALSLFGEASCLEELGNLKEAKSRYEAIQTSYPSPSVIQIKLKRIEERMKQGGGTLSE